MGWGVEGLCWVVRGVRNGHVCVGLGEVVSGCQGLG